MTPPRNILWFFLVLFLPLFVSCQEYQANREHTWYRLLLHEGPDTGWETYVFEIQWYADGGMDVSSTCTPTGGSSASAVDHVNNAIDGDVSTKYRTANGTTGDYDHILCEFTSSMELGEVSTSCATIPAALPPRRSTIPFAPPTLALAAFY
jgi:hypothetical protein